MHMICLSVKARDHAVICISTLLQIFIFCAIFCFYINCWAVYWHHLAEVCYSKMCCFVCRLYLYITAMQIFQLTPLMWVGYAGALIIYIFHQLLIVSFKFPMVANVYIVPVITLDSNLGPRVLWMSEFEY